MLGASCALMYDVEKASSNAGGTPGMALISP